MASVFSFTVAKLDGQLFSLSHYSGMPLLIVNTASRCGLTNMNVPLLCDVHRAYSTRGFSVLAFPCSQFAAQEPLNACQLEDWRQQRSLPFPLFEKIDVKGPKASPLWVMLQQHLGPVPWNFTKFLCDKQGVPVKKLDPSASPDVVHQAVQSLLS
jgi:glutathione peroxidase